MTKINKFQREKNIELADILRAHIVDYQDKYPLYPEQYKIVFDLLNCRTAYLGGHIDRCMECGEEHISYNSCRNRHCPKCQNLPREKWLEGRRADLLPVKYFHNVFTLPHELNPIILANKKVMLNILFKSVAETLLSFGKNPKKGLNGKLGFISVLHTWDQLLQTHFHLHCLVPGGAVSEDWQNWHPCKKKYLFNVKALSLVFRGKFIDHLRAAYKQDKLYFPGILAPLKNPGRFKQLINSLYGKKWVVYIKKPIERPEFIIKYLGRYTHRVAISNQRILSLKEGMVTFTRKNRDINKIIKETIPAVEFIRRFLLHALPKKFVRIRHYGYLSSRNKKQHLAQIRKLMGVSVTVTKSIEKSVQEIMLELTGVDISLCPCCRKGKMKQVGEIALYTGRSGYDVIRPPNLRITA
jgi:hypothetical protein